MPKSRKRGGQKAHNKRVKVNNNIKTAQQAAMQKLFNEAMQKQIEEYKKQKEANSGNTEA